LTYTELTAISFIENLSRHNATICNKRRRVSNLNSYLEKQFTEAISTADSTWYLYTSF